MQPGDLKICRAFTRVQCAPVVSGESAVGRARMAKLLYVIICSLAVQSAAEMGRQRRWRMERRKKAAAAAAAARREREKNAPRDAESTKEDEGRPAD